MSEVRLIDVAVVGGNCRTRDGVHLLWTWNVLRVINAPSPATASLAIGRVLAESMPIFGCVNDGEGDEAGFEAGS